MSETMEVTPGCFEVNLISLMEKRYMEMSIKKQSIMLIAGLATVVSISSVNAFEGSVPSASAFAVEQASDAFESALTAAASYEPCSYEGIDSKGYEEYYIETHPKRGFNLGYGSYVAYNPASSEDGGDMDFLALAVTQCGGPQAEATQ